MSRREMVMLVGSGVVFAGTVKGEDIAIEADATCQPVALKTGKGTDGRLLLVADTCCLDGFEIVRAGRGGTKASSRAVTNLKALDDALVHAKKDSLLLEYCVMMWGLTEKQRDDTVADLAKRYIPSGK
jgi:hypothetical protein